MSEQQKKSANADSIEGRPKPRTSSFIRGRRKEAAKRVFLLGVLIPAVFAGLFALIWFNREDQQSGEDDRPVVGTESSFEVDMQDGNIVALKSRSDEIAGDVTRVALPQKVSMLMERIEIAERLEELAVAETDEGILHYSQIAKIDSLVLLDALNVIHGLDEDSYREQLFEYATPLLDSEHDVVKTQAHIGVCQTYVQHFVFDYTDENFELLMEQMEKSVPHVMKNSNSAASFDQMLAMIYGAVPDSETDERVRRLHLYVGNQFRMSDDPIVWRLGTAVHNRMIMGEVNFNALRNVVSIGEESAIEEVKTIVDGVIESGLAGRGVYLELLEMCEGMVHTGHGELGNELLDRLERSVPEIKEELTRVEVELIFQRRVQRNALKGEVFDLSGTDVLEREISSAQLDGKAVVIVMFSMVDADSLSPVRRLGDYAQYSSSGVEFIAACGDSEKGAEVYQTLIESLPDVVFTSGETGKEYLKRCPLTYVPYILILDREHRVVELNPDMEDLRTILNSI
ncbi:MAG: hypothetical protein AAF456_21185 [Planctomycetota bacterium]